MKVSALQARVIQRVWVLWMEGQEAISSSPRLTSGALAYNMHDAVW